MKTTQACDFVAETRKCRGFQAKNIILVNRTNSLKKFSIYRGGGGRDLDHEHGICLSDNERFYR